MKIWASLGLCSISSGWDGPWTGVNKLTNDVRQSNDLQELNRDPRLTFIDIASHGYSEKAVKQCGMRYMGPMFYENWTNNKDLNEDGTCASPDVNYATQFADRNVRYWYLGSDSLLRDLAPGIDLPNPWAYASHRLQAHHQCFDEIKSAGGLNLPYCFSRFSRRQYDHGAGDFYLPESSKKCVEANMFHMGPDRIDGIFYDTGSTRGPIRYGQEAQDIDIESHKEIVSYAKNLFRDHVLDREAVVITNVGGSANPRQIMEGKHDSITLKEHNIDTYPNFFTGTCPDSDPYWENDLRCVFHSEEEWNQDRKVWRAQFNNLIKYGPLDPQTMYVQGWYHETLRQHSLDNFGEDFITRFIRFAAESHIGVITFSHGGNGDPLAVDNGADFYDEVFNHPIFQPCEGTWQEWGTWSNCDRSCLDGIRMRERECSAGSAGLCDGSERDVQVCNDEPCYDWPVKGWTHWAAWSQCSKSCGGGTMERRRLCKDMDNDCGGEDYQLSSCNTESCPVNNCGKELRISAPESMHTERFFPYEGLYHRTEKNPTSERPQFIKFHRDIELIFDETIQAWIVRDNSIDKIVLLSFTNAFCPEHISTADWNYFDFDQNEYVSGQDVPAIIFTIAEEGAAYEASNGAYSLTNKPVWNSWSDWSSCHPSCGPNGMRQRMRTCDTDLCLGPKEESEACADLAACATDKHDCISDSNGVKWRPLVLQWRKNGGIPMEKYQCLKTSQTTPCTVGADPPLAEEDFINLDNFAQYQIDGKYHMKMLWDFGESIEWKQEESIFEINQEQTVSEAVGTNHKGHTELMFQGLSQAAWAQRFEMQMFDGSTNQPQRYHWDESMTSCAHKNGEWRTYALVVWDHPNKSFDKPQWYSTWLSNKDAEDAPFDGNGFLGDGEGMTSDVWCMSTQMYYEMGLRGQENNFIALYIEDETCPDDGMSSFPEFVRCSGPGAVMPRDGASCTCGKGSSWNSESNECECAQGYMETPYVNWRRNPICVLCGGVGATVGFYGECSCGSSGATLGENSVCGCSDGQVLSSDGSSCYDGVDIVFDSKKYTCEADELDVLLDDLNYDWGLKNAERLTVDCETFEDPAIRVTLIGENAQGVLNTGIEPVLRPDSWRNHQIMSATLAYEVFYPEDHEFLQNEFLPGFYHDGPSDGYRLTRIKMKNKNLEMHDAGCDFCASVNAAGSLGTMTAGVWHKIEMRLRLNDEGEANGEFLFFFDDILTSHITGLSNMIPDMSYHITHARMWVYNAWPGAENNGFVFFKNFYVTKFSSDETMTSIYTTATPTGIPTTTYPSTTTPLTTTTVPPKDCKCSNSDVLDEVTNTNSGNHFPLIGECDEVAGKNKNEDWTFFCDVDGDGQKGESEESISFTMNKKCKKASKGVTSIDCGDAAKDECNCHLLPKDCPNCDSECISATNKAVRMRFSCPADSDKPGVWHEYIGKCKKIPKSKTNLNCGGSNGGGGDELDCKCSKQISKLIPNGGGAVCISNSNKKKPTWRIFCDDNGNDDFDDGEDFQDIQNKCKKLKSTISC